MKLNINLVYIILLLLTIATSLTALANHEKATVVLILSIALAKVLLVSFYFMELIDAHRAWRIIIFVFGIILISGMLVFY
ncbi:MAG: cytochrome C oxidase subunit IV family protein [Bacteroidales bacterium]|jgi:caa(3)-type oxidase subunit IV|nr:cytochrome C oxidase subunit IV family protein [Bacteroidales bacterium]MCK9448651.1 cytochrome C oxidase subunit IV family protein [Bacteroidales bacterium]MDD3702188.1 cytochrome C oxidase subunit IV family protein [Bacteroidales bacterium]MDY0368938.1 cytochrome C oxidase subunit IV family protein [Bacteroidales bacterium]